MCRKSSVMKAWQKRMTSPSLLPWGLKFAPPLAPHRRVVSEFLKTCSKPRDFRTERFTLLWKRRPPLYGPMALLN